MDSRRVQTTSCSRLVDRYTLSQHRPERWCCCGTLRGWTHSAKRTLPSESLVREWCTRLGCDMQFESILETLHAPYCMPVVRTPTWGPLEIPFYLINARCLVERRRNAMNNLWRLGIADITIVHCADADELRRLPNATYRTLHPGIVETRWGRAGSRLPMGTVSLALKHMIAARDLLRRGVARAGIVEDDVVFAPTAASVLQQRINSLPGNTMVYHAGSYSRVHQTFARYPLTAPGCRERRNDSWIIGATAYVLWRRAASQLIHPVIAAADVALTLQTAPIFAPQPSCGGDTFEAWPDPTLTGGTHLRAHNCTLTHAAILDEVYALARYGHSLSM